MNAAGGNDTEFISLSRYKIKSPLLSLFFSFIVLSEITGSSSEALTTSSPKPKTIFRFAVSDSLDLWRSYPQEFDRIRSVSLPTI